MDRSFVKAQYFTFIYNWSSCTLMNCLNIQAERSATGDLLSKYGAKLQQSIIHSKATAYKQVSLNRKTDPIERMDTFRLGIDTTRPHKHWLLFVVQQPDQIHMAVFFLVPCYSDLSATVRSYNRTSNILQGTRNTQPCITGHPVLSVVANTLWWVIVRQRASMFIWPHCTWWPIIHDCVLFGV